MRSNGHSGDPSSAGAASATTAGGDGAAGAKLRAQLVRAEGPTVVPRVVARQGVLGALLGVPLRWKLIGANLLVVLGACLAVLVARTVDATLLILALALLASIGVSHLLVTLALQPLRDLERTATRVWQGDLESRVMPSPLADRDMVRVGSTLNLLLDGLLADRARMRLLATQVINAQDQERARVARELHDSTAQTLAAAMYQLSAAARMAEESEDVPLQERLDELRQLVQDAIEEVRTLSHTIHPRVLDDLGLVAALEWLARQTREQGELDVVVETGPGTNGIPHAIASVLYRVAQESLRNAVQHAHARMVHITAQVNGETARLTVADDGQGFDVKSAEARRPGMGLFSIRERAALVDGTVEIQSLPGKGSTIIATVPLSASRSS